MSTRPASSKEKSFKPHQMALMIAAVASVAAWAFPIARIVLLPLQYLNTHLHEMCHAITAVLTGGVVERIIVASNGSGNTPVEGGIMPLVASAGYVGASCIGAAVILCSRTEKGARWTLRVLGIALLFSMLMWVRGDLVGVISGFAWAVALVGLSNLRGMWLLFVAQLIGLQQCLNAVQSLYELLQISAMTDMHSDATIMSQLTGVPAIFWAVIWCAFSLVLVIVCLRKAWR